MFGRRVVVLAAVEIVEIFHFFQSFPQPGIANSNERHLNPDPKAILSMTDSATQPTL
jgi:hypothetical protein